MPFDLFRNQSMSKRGLLKKIKIVLFACLGAMPCRRRDADNMHREDNQLHEVQSRFHETSLARALPTASAGCIWTLFWELQTTTISFNFSFSVAKIRVFSDDCWVFCVDSEVTTLKQCVPVQLCYLNSAWLMGPAHNQLTFLSICVQETPAIHARSRKTKDHKDHGRVQASC